MEGQPETFVGDEAADGDEAEFFLWWMPVRDDLEFCGIDAVFREEIFFALEGGGDFRCGVLAARDGGAGVAVGCGVVREQFVGVAQGDEKFVFFGAESGEFFGPGESAVEGAEDGGGAGP